MECPSRPCRTLLLVVRSLLSLGSLLESLTRFVSSFCTQPLAQQKPTSLPTIIIDPNLIRYSDNSLRSNSTLSSGSIFALAWASRRHARSLAPSSSSSLSSTARPSRRESSPTAGGIVSSNATPSCALASAPRSTAFTPQGQMLTSYQPTSSSSKTSLMCVLLEITQLLK